MIKSNPQHLTLLITCLILSVFSLGSIVNFTDPYSSSILTKIFFYISLFLFCQSLFSLLGLVIRQIFWPKLYIINLSISFRQAALLSFFIIASAILLTQGILFWWVALTLILFFASLEAFFNLKI